LVASHILVCVIHKLTSFFSYHFWPLACGWESLPMSFVLPMGCRCAGGPHSMASFFFSSSIKFIYLIFFFFFFLRLGTERTDTHRVAHLRFLLTSPIPVRRGVTLPTYRTP
jgi:hypothetical protein